MTYTIAELEDVHGDMFVIICKTGSEYSVSLYNDETSESTTKHYETIEAACEVFERFARAFAMGWYSYETRKAFLK